MAVLLVKFEYYRIFGFSIFLLASFTDLLDGYLARKRDQVTALGKLLDPLADKLLVAAAFISLAELKAIPAWMVVVIVGRELLVTALRSFIEERGADFSAKMAGKWKMLLQCFAAGVGLFYLSYPTSTVDGIATVEAPRWCAWLLAASVWSAGELGRHAVACPMLTT